MRGGWERRHVGMWEVVEELGWWLVGVAKGLVGWLLAAGLRPGGLAGCGCLVETLARVFGAARFRGGIPRECPEPRENWLGHFLVERRVALRLDD